MQNALLNVPAHDFDPLVVDRRGRGNVVTEVRENSRRSRDYEEESEPVYHEPEQKPEPVSEPEPTRESEPVYNEPEPTRGPEPSYHEPEPIREPEPVYHEPEPVREPAVDNAPSLGDELSKGQD